MPAKQSDVQEEGPNGEEGHDPDKVNHDRVEGTIFVCEK
jgi:hypothetical protein